MTKTYWWSDVPNFGDRLAPLLLKHFSNITDEIYQSPSAELSDLVTIGSLLEHIPSTWSGTIAGSGKLLRDSKLTLDNANILGVRGPLSAQGLKNIAIGDPGLLADELVDIATRDIDLGIVPHWSDTRLAHDYRFQFTNSRIVISAWKDPLEVLSLIGRCKRIVTSSLHGVIAADAFDIPRRTEIAHRMLIDPKEGGTFKFEDYNASVNVPFRIGEMQYANRNRVSDRKNEVYDMYKEIR